jgi:hypothetical protein
MAGSGGGLAGVGLGGRPALGRLPPRPLPLALVIENADPFDFRQNQTEKIPRVFV